MSDSLAAWLKISQIPDYLHDTYGRRVSRQTAYSYLSTGVGGVKLRWEEHFGQKFTQKVWVDEFVRETGVA